MKRLFILLSFLLVLASCSKENVILPEPESSIVLSDGTAPSGDLTLSLGPVHQRGGSPL